MMNSRCPTTVGSLSNNFFKVPSVDFTLWWWYHSNFLEKRNKLKVIYISPSAIARDSQESLTGNEKL